MNKAALLAATPILLAFGQARSARSEWSLGSQPVRLATSSSFVGDDSVAKTAYEKNCRKCHGPNGVPSKAMLKKFPKIEIFDASFFSKRSDDSITTILSKGTTKDMKSFKDKLSRDDMKAVAAYIRTFAK